LHVIGILVVNDGLIAWRPFARAGQLAFGTSDSGASGQVAPALAYEKPFDSIFLQVRMAGLHGFTTCSKIRQTAANCRTSIVFVISHPARSGRGGFPRKPV
jgi:DNA-binding response OmpR family regulator